MATDRVRRVQELRRSSAASPRPGRRLCDEPWDIEEYDEAPVDSEETSASP